MNTNGNSGLEYQCGPVFRNDLVGHSFSHDAEGLQGDLAALGHACRIRINPKWDGLVLQVAV